MSTQSQSGSDAYVWKTKPSKVQFWAFKRAISRRSLGIFFQQRMGKTKVAIDCCGYWYKFEFLRKVLIVCPLPIRSVWQEQIEAHLPDDIPREVHFLSSTDKLPEFTGNLQFLIATYDLAWRNLDRLLKWRPQAVICDEVHKLKHRGTRRSKALAKLGSVAQYRLGLSGTPYSKLEDLFSEFRFIDPTVLGTSWTGFAKKYLVMGGYMNKLIVDYKNKEELLSLVASAAVVAERKEHMREPEREDVFIQVPSSSKFSRLYDELKKKMVLELESGNLVAVNRVTLLLRLLQLCSGIASTDREITWVDKSKLETLKALVESITEDGNKVLIFCKFIPEVEQISAMFPNSVTIFGEVSEAQRIAARQKFATDDNCKVAVVQIDSGGEGISFAAAHHVIFFSLSYSLTSFLQAKDRVMGREQQSDLVTYYYLVRKGLADEKLVKRILAGEDFIGVTTEQLKSLLT